MPRIKIPRYICLLCEKKPEDFSAMMRQTCIGICTKCCIDHRLTKTQVLEKFHKDRKTLMERYPTYARPYIERYYEMNKKILEGDY